jgi:hypothetical protein
MMNSASLSAANRSGASAASGRLATRIEHAGAFSL